MATENDRFLPIQDSGYFEKDERQEAAERQWPLRSNLLIHLGLVFLYTISSLALIHHYSIFPPWQRFSSDLSIAYASTIFKNLTANPFAGVPSPSIDASWELLLAPLNIRVTKEELERSGQNSVELSDGGGYLAWLGVFHELHCIKMLRHWNYREFYYPNISTTEEAHLSSHADHCFEMLRQASICHADLSLTTFNWDMKKTKPMFDASESRHMCVDWGKLVASLKGRVVQDAEIERLRNPFLPKAL